MKSFSERHGYKPDRSRLYQFEEMDCRLRNAIWNFLLKDYFCSEFGYNPNHLIRMVWTDVAGKRSDDLPHDVGVVYPDVVLKPVRACECHEQAIKEIHR